NNHMKVHRMHSEPWNVTLVDTGLFTMTGGRIKKIREYVEGETFCLTYGDGVSDININEIIMHHKNQKTYATLTAVRQHGRFGVFNLKKSESRIKYFKEKPEMEGDESAWINGGFFVLDSEVIDYIDDDSTVFEKTPLERLAADNQLAAFRHTGFWQPMDTLRDKNLLEDYWNSGNPPWKVW
ncbi:MAG: sugar phosphate nucleotidyltransferase, partial [Bacteroidota bacterium]